MASSHDGESTESESECVSEWTACAQNGGTYSTSPAATVTRTAGGSGGASLALPLPTSCSRVWRRDGCVAGWRRSAGSASGG